MAGALAAVASLVVVIQAPTALVAKAVPANHGAKPASLTFRATFELQCGRASAATVGLPAAMGVRTIKSTAVTVNGVHPASVRTSHHVLRVTMPPPRGMICNSIGPARVTLRIAGPAGLVNPAKPGSYAVWLRVRGQTASGHLRIS